jgi:putative glycosyltransferase (TIGR04372 family)
MSIAAVRDSETSGRLMMIDRVIDWHALARLPLVFRRDESLEGQLRLFVLQELATIPELGLSVSPFKLGNKPSLTFLHLAPDSRQPEKIELDRFVGLLAKHGQLEQLRIAIRQQIEPWLPWLAKFSDADDVIGVMTSEMLKRHLPQPVAMLIKELREVAAFAKGKMTGATQLPAVARFGSGMSPLADSMVYAGIAIGSDAASIAKSTGLHRLFFGQNKSPKIIRRQGSGRVKEKLLPYLDSILRSSLRSVARDVVRSNQHQLGWDAQNTSHRRLAHVSRLLRLRGRLFFSEGDYRRAFLFFLSSLVWGNKKALLNAATAAQLCGCFADAEPLYRAFILKNGSSHLPVRGLAFALLPQGKVQEASFLLSRSAREHPAYAMAHQNLAGNYDASRYIPRFLDRSGYPEVQLYDAYNLTGERLVHIGRGDEGVRCYGEALRLQEILAKRVAIPHEIRKILSDEYAIPEDAPIRILPYEWVTLIGHTAMLDSYLKLQKLGMGPAGYPILLAPSRKVANKTYLNLWRPHVTVVEDPYLVDDLFPYQRCVGDCFNGYLRKDGSAGDWTELGAIGQIAWDVSGQGPLIQIPDWLQKAGKKTLRKMGLGPNDWFVTLHIRSTGYHKESNRSMQVHRNADIEDYLLAIRAITNAGGWVIRMGDASMAPLPVMDRLIDYPHTEFKSEECDIFLAASAKFFIGTTSGLMNTVMSFGTPCLLVNCVSNYFQLWNNRVLFTLKPLWSHVERRYLSVAEITEERFRWKIFNINQLMSMGIEPHANSAEEIEAATLEMLERVNHGPVMKETEADRCLKQACEQSGNRSYFGNGKLSHSFFNARRKDLFNI